MYEFKRPSEGWQTLSDGLYFPVKQHSGRLKNSFEKDAVAKEIDLQREVTQEFGKNATQATAAVADKLGNTRSYERYQEARTLLEAEL